MSSGVALELIGYLGSALVVISLAMSSITRLRVLNLAGALVFTVHGILIGSLPIALTNAVVATLTIWYLYRQERYFCERGFEVAGEGVQLVTGGVS